MKPLHIEENALGAPQGSFQALKLPTGVTLTGQPTARQIELLSPAALAFVAALERAFGPRREALLERRVRIQERLDAGERPDFLEETRGARLGEWTVQPVPADLQNRRVEITGPVDRKMIINALNSPAQVFMADFEDSTSPTFANLLDGQVNLFDAVRRTIEFDHPTSGKSYRLNEHTATLMVRPRGWHMVERHVQVDGRSISAALFDFGLFFFHNAHELIARGSGPYFYLPKLESHHEARLWNEVFVHAQAALGIPTGTIKATVLIETILAAFEMDEILFELREHSAGLNCGRWDYIFSFIKKFKSHEAFVLPDRGAVGMDQPFLNAYSRLLVQTCHHRGVHAIGGMAAQIPVKDDEAKNAAALARVARDKRREALNGHDGTWIAHPGLFETAHAEFQRVLGDAPHQIDAPRPWRHIDAHHLLELPSGPLTEAGLRTNLSVGVRYVAAWLDGMGCVPIEGLMEDAATAEISRTQLWQQVRHGAFLDDGRRVNVELLRAVLRDELAALARDLGPARFESGRFKQAADLFEQLVTAEELEDFLTLVAYEQIN